jgi:hypothetical protein
MKNSQRGIILPIVIALIVIVSVVTIAWYYKNSKEIEGARTLYTGEVEIEPMDKLTLRSQLDFAGCNKPAALLICHELDNGGVEIYPDGPGFGPLSFTILGNKIFATKDIDGKPDIEKYKAEVRKDVEAIGNIVEIKENTWKLTETKYPWTVMY